MSHSPIIKTTDESPTRYVSLKLMEKKLASKTDWAELVRGQQALAEQMIQREKEQRMLQRMEWNDTLNSMVSDKNVVKQMELEAKQRDYLQSLIRKQNYDQYVVQMKEAKSGLQKMIADEYTKEKMIKDEDERIKMEQKKQIEGQIINNAVDSLERERLMREAQKNHYAQNADQALQQYQMQKLKDKELAKRYQEEHNKLVQENIHDRNMKDLNYKRYYNQISEKQNNRQQQYDNQVGQITRANDKRFESFVNQGVEEAKRKAEEEERRREQKRQDDLKRMMDLNNSKVKEHEDSNMQYKLAYKDRVEQQQAKNQLVQNYNEQLKRTRASQSMDYRNFLQEQMKLTDEQRLKENSTMLDHERKINLERFDHMIPGIKSSKYDSLLTPNIKTTKNKFLPTNGSGMYRNDSTPQLVTTPNAYYLKQPNHTLTSTKSQASFSLNTSSMSPTSPDKKFESYNPITNPLPNTLQNPYISRDITKGRGSESYLASVANKSFLN